MCPDVRGLEHPGSCAIPTSPICWRFRARAAHDLRSESRRPWGIGRERVETEAFRITA
jgi:hypothetical protein